MPKVSVYVRPTTGNRTPKKATKGSTGPFYLRYELNGKRIWESLTTRTYTFALADARSKESQLLRDEAHPPKPSPAPPKSLEELRTAFIHDKKSTFKKDGTPLDPGPTKTLEYGGRLGGFDLQLNFPSSQIPITTEVQLRIFNEGIQHPK